MKVTLLHATPLWVASHGARTCWNSGDKSDTKEAVMQAQQDAILEDNDCFFSSDNIIGEKDAELIDRVGNKFKHASILEHVSYNFYIEGISRACLQELARHRLTSLSVKSTRYTLKELKNELPFCSYEVQDGMLRTFGTEEQKDMARKYLVFTGIDSVDIKSISALELLRQELTSGTSNDRAKYCLPESYKTEITWTINIRSLQNFLSLRTDRSALWEIRDLAYMIYGNLPKEHKYLLTSYVKPEK